MNIENLNLIEILENGEKGNIPVLTKEDWELISYLINKSGKSMFDKGQREGYKKGYREGGLNVR